MRLEDFPDETCAWCGKDYESRHPGQKYCCYECRRQSVRAFTMELRREERKRNCRGRTCKQCGKTYHAFKRTQLYCSQACGKAAWYDRKRGKPLSESISEVRCLGCGGTIPDARKPSRQYCRSCAGKRQVARQKRMAARAGRTCRECGTIFDARKDAQWHCSKRCRERDRKRRKREASLSRNG